MTERDAMPQLPTSGQIIGALVSKLGIKHPVLQDRTARRYFAANPEQLVKDTSRAEIIGAIAESLTDFGLITSSQLREEDYEPAPALAAMLEWHADNWDQMRSFLRRRTMEVLPSHLPKVWAAYVRLAVIDLSIRLAAHLHLAGSSPVVLDILTSANVGSRGAYLNRKRQQAGISLDDFAESVSVAVNTVDAWMYRGVRPYDDNISKIAKALAVKIEGSNAASIAAELRALYWVSDVAELLAEHIGAEAVDEAIGRLHGYAAETYRIIEERFPAENRAADLTVLADLGAGTRIAEPLLSALVEQERDDEWREDLRATGMKWVHRVLSVNLNVHLAEVDDLIEKTDGRLLEDWDVSSREAYAHYRRSHELGMEGKFREAMTEVEIAARLDPLDPANQFSLGSVKTGIGIERGDTVLISEGMEALWLAVALDPNWIIPWTEIGLTLIQLGRPEEAVEHLRNAKPECGPLDSRYHSALGAAYWKINRLPEALAAFEEALELEPGDTSALLSASEIALLIGDREKHRRYLRKARHFGAEEDTLKIWEMLREFGEKDSANTGTAKHDRTIAVMDAVIKLCPDDEYAHMRRGLAHFAKGNDDLAIADLDAVLQLDTDHADAYMLRGIVYGYLERYDLVVADMSELIRLKPDDAMAYYRRGMAYGEQDALDEALSDLCEAIRLDPDNADAYRVRGDCLRYKEEYDKAIADFDIALQLDSENAAAYLGRGAAYRMKGNLAQAVADYDDTVRLKPEGALGYRFRADAHIANENYDQAISDCNRALKLNPHDPITHFKRGNAHLFSGQPEPALADFNKAVELDPTSGRSTYGRGLVRLILEDTDGAEGDFQRARELGYDDDDLEC